jgi:hypothetical protein
MPLKTLVVIAIRLYAIYWFVQSLADLLMRISTIGVFLTRDGEMLSLIYLLIPLVMISIAVFLWIIASWLSSRVTKGRDTQLEFTVLTGEVLYSFAFVFLGLYFALASISAFMQRAYQFFAIGTALEEGNPQKSEFLLQLAGPTLTLLTGLLCVLFAGGLARKLIRWDNKNSTPTTPTT